MPTTVAPHAAWNGATLAMPGMSSTGGQDGNITGTDGMGMVFHNPWPVTHDVNGDAVEWANVDSGSGGSLFPPNMNGGMNAWGYYYMPGFPLPNPTHGQYTSTPHVPSGAPATHAAFEESLASAAPSSLDQTVPLMSGQVPNSTSLRSKAASSCRRSVTSVGWKSTRGTSPLLSPLEQAFVRDSIHASACRCRRRSAIRILNEWTCRRRANASPMPEPPPVTRATLPRASPCRLFGEDRASGLRWAHNSSTSAMVLSGPRVVRRMARLLMRSTVSPMAIESRLPC